MHGIKLPRMVKRGITSFKVYMTYPKWRLEDYQLLEVLSVAEREGALVMVHAENDDITWTRETPTMKVTGPDGHPVRGRFSFVLVSSPPAAPSSTASR